MFVDEAPFARGVTAEVLIKQRDRDGPVARQRNVLGSSSASTRSLIASIGCEVAILERGHN